MNKYYGKVGFAETKETSPGVWVEDIVEKNYYGDIVRNIRNLESSGKVNDDISLSNNISIVSDPYAVENFHSIRYVEFMNAKWKVLKVEVNYPRLLLVLGGVYNG